MRIGSGSHVGIPTAGLGGGWLAFPPGNQFPVSVVFLTILGIVIRIRAPVLLATVAVQLALPGEFSRGGALLFRDAIPVAAFSLVTVGGNFLGFLACALVLAYGRALFCVFELLDRFVLSEKAFDVSRNSSFIRKYVSCQT